MHAQQASAPQTNDLDRGRQAAYPTVLFPTQSVANSPRSRSSLLPNAPLVKQKRASRSAQRSLTTSLNSIPNISSSPSRGSTPVASPKSDSSSKSPRGSFLRDSQLATDSPHKTLRPKSSHHQSLLDLRDELQKRSESGVYHSVALLTHAHRDHSFPNGNGPQLVSLVRLIWHLPGTPTPLERQSHQSTTGLLLLPPMLSVVGILVKHRSLLALASSANASPLLWPARRQTFHLTLVCSRSPHRGVLAPLRRHYPLAPRRVPLHLVLYPMFPPARRGKLIPLLRPPAPPPQGCRYPPLLDPH